MMENSEDKPAEKQQPKPPRRDASFRISVKALDLLISSKATAYQIGAYLTLARFTDESGRFSSAGYEAIYNATGAAPGTEKKPSTGRQLVQQLMGIAVQVETAPAKRRADRNRYDPIPPTYAPDQRQRLLYLPSEWEQIFGEKVPERPTDRSQVRFVLNDFGGDEWVWFGAGLVDGFGRFRQPLRRLKQLGDVPARLLLLLYKANDMEQFGGVPPYPNVYEKYKTAHCASYKGHTFWRAEEKHITSYDSIAQSSIGLAKLSINEKERQDQFKPLFDALTSLDSAGFIYRIVTVMDGDPVKPDSRPVYELHARTHHSGHPPAGEEGIALKVEHLARRVIDGWQHTCDAAGRFSSTYPAMVRYGVEPYVVGIYRIRFRVTNPKNYGVTRSFSRIRRDHADYLDEIERLEKTAPPAKDKEPTAPPSTHVN